MSDILPTIDDVLNNFAKGIRSSDYADNGYSAYVTFKAEAKAGLSRLMDKREIEGQIKEHKKSGEARTLVEWQTYDKDRLAELEQQLKSLNSNEESGK